jgi:hypothetical protein
MEQTEHTTGGMKSALKYLEQGVASNVVFLDDQREQKAVKAKELETPKTDSDVWGWRLAFGFSITFWLLVALFVCRFLPF